MPVLPFGSLSQNSTIFGILKLASLSLQYDMISFFVTSLPALFKEIKVQGIDLYVTGEPKHGAYYLAQELGLNVFYGGHYLTETFGMKALGEHLGKGLNISTEFIDAPCIF